MKTFVNGQLLNWKEYNDQKIEINYFFLKQNTADVR